MRTQEPDWPKVVARLVEGDRFAFLELSRLVTQFLVSNRAFDFRDDWDDVIQDVVLATVNAVRDQKINDPRAVVGYIRTATRFKFVDRIRSRKREAPRACADEPEVETAQWQAPEIDDRERQELWDAVRRLPQQQREAVVEVYAHGHTYDEASAKTGIPLGSLKRHLRQGLAALQQHLASTPPT